LPQSSAVASALAEAIFQRGAYFRAGGMVLHGRRVLFRVTQNGAVHGNDGDSGINLFPKALGQGIEGSTFILTEKTGQTGFGGDPGLIFQLRTQVIKLGASGRIDQMESQYAHADQYDCDEGKGDTPLNTAEHL
jgi:hypothetical protein